MNCLIKKDRNMKTLKYISLALFVASSALTFTSCSDDEKGDPNSPMTINQIYLEDADAEDGVKDRAVDFARLGQLIRIEGSGFLGLQRILVNGYATEFNNTMVTDNNIWVTLDGDTPIADADADYRNTITLIKGGSTLKYNFTIRSASPSITSFSLTLPEAGELVTVYGANLQETTKITLPDGTEITSGIVSDEDGEWFTFTMPSGVDPEVGGSILTEGANGQGKSPAQFNERRTMILDFDGRGTQGGWSATYTSDDLVGDPLNSGRGNVVPVVPESVLAEGGIKNGAHGNGWFTAGNGVDDWTAYTEIIPAETPVENIAFQFDIYVPGTWSGAGYLEFTFQNNLSSYGWGSTETTNTKNITYPTAVCWCPWYDEAANEVTPYTTDGKWVTITIPVSKVGKYQEPDTYTFADVIADRAAASYANFGMFLVNSDIKSGDEVLVETGTFNQMIYVDNWRIVPNETFTISDF